MVKQLEQQLRTMEEDALKQLFDEAVSAINFYALTEDAVFSFLVALYGEEEIAERVYNTMPFHETRKALSELVYVCMAQNFKWGSHASRKRWLEELAKG